MVRKSRRSERISRRKRTDRKLKGRKDKRSRRQTRKRGTKRKERKKDKKITSKLPKIFVINLKRDEEKWSKYKKDKRFIRFSACNGVEMSKENPYFERLRIMWNAGDRKKKCTAGILTSHLGVIKKVHQSKSKFPKKGVLIIEDDAQINFVRLQKAMKNVNKYKESIFHSWLETQNRQ